MSEFLKVAVRCRPMSQKEKSEGNKIAVTVNSVSKTCTLESTTDGGKVFQFDAAFGPNCTTEQVYENVGSVIVEAVLNGYNGTVFAYGQTGCGKSHTMSGFIERTLDHIFEATSTASSNTRYLALLSYLEIYNEKLRDLLRDEHIDGQLQLKEDPIRGTYVGGGLREVTVKDAIECSQLVEQGSRRRALAATKMNATSSRSHAVLTISIEALAMDENINTGSTAVRRGRLHLVDLAGSERQGRTGATGDRLKEAASINLSLSALGNVISALAAGNGRHVPYRDSKLTRLLKDSLGGNARTLMIACVSPSHNDSEETISTLRYATRARCIKNKPIINEDPKDALLRQYQLELERLKKLLENTTTKNESIDEDIEHISLDNHNNNDIEKSDDDIIINNNNNNDKFQSNKNQIKIINETIKDDNNNNGETIEIPGGQIWTSTTRYIDDKRRKKQEIAKKEVMQRLERLTIGGEAHGDTELKKRRERRRKRLEIIATALETSARDGDGSAFEVYGQLKTTEDALKRMAKKTKQLEAESLDLQASWDADRRELLRRELLATQICDAMLPHLRPGCPLRDITAVRAAATWCDELGRWKLPDVSSRIPLPPPPSINKDINKFKNEFNNNNDDKNYDDETESFKETNKNNWKDIAGSYFKRNRIDELLARAREAKTFETDNIIGKSVDSDDLINNYNQLNLQPSSKSLPSTSSQMSIKTSGRPIGSFNGWLAEDSQTICRIQSSSSPPMKKVPPRVLEALPSYTLDMSPSS